MIARTADVERELAKSLDLVEEFECAVSIGLRELLELGWSRVDIVSIVDRARRHLLFHGRQPKRGG